MMISRQNSSDQSEFTISQVFRMVRANKDPSVILAEAGSFEYEIVLENDEVNAGSYLKGGVILSTTKIPSSLHIGFQGHIRIGGRKIGQHNSVPSKKHIKTVALGSIDEIVETPLDNDMAPKNQTFSKLAKNREASRMKSAQIYQNLNNSSIVFQRNFWKLFEFTWSFRSKAPFLFFPFCIKLPENLPGSSKIQSPGSSKSSLISLRNLTMNSQFQEEVFDRFTIGYEVVVLAKYHALEARPQDEVTKDFTVIPLSQVPKPQIQFSSPENSFASFFSFCIKESVRAEIDRDILRSEIFENTLSLKIKMSKDLLETIEYSGILVSLTEVTSIFENEMDFSQKFSDLYSTNESLRSKISLSLSLEQLPRYNSDIDVKGAQIKHFLIGQLVKTNSQDYSEVFRFQIRIENNRKSATFSFNLKQEEKSLKIPDDSISMPYATFSTQEDEESL